MDETVIVILGILLPLVGTCLGASMVFLLKKGMRPGLQKLLLGFAAGVMTAASVWSLLIPAIDMTAEKGGVVWLPALVGFLLGIGFLLVLDMLIPHLHLNAAEPEGPNVGYSKSTMLILAVTLHNIPEGMAVGVVFAGILSGTMDFHMSAALVLALGIAIQNMPEGAVISMPLLGQGYSRRKAFGVGALSGVVEPLGALVTILLTSLVVPALPYILAFAAGAMIYVVVEELIPESQEGKHSNIGTIGMALGFALMMVLDVALG
ncbi:MAG: family metal transporter [Firmicutes bacterium]|nr:family metal transporter [Bacillota bacterium]